MDMILRDKLERLDSLLLDMGRIVVAFSGGVDSTFLLRAALRVLDKREIIPVIALSPTYPRAEFRQAVSMAKKMGVHITTIVTDELSSRKFRLNPENRCYYCKHELFGRLTMIARSRHAAHVVDGTNLDDLKDIRFGRKAAAKFGVRSPLLEARFTKSDIRALSKRWALPTWRKPSMACLASRIPFNDSIDQDKLGKVEKAEAFLNRLGLRQARVRLHRDVARIELDEYGLRRIMAIVMRRKVIRYLKKLGIPYVTVDIEGYRTGSMHEALHIDKK